MIFILRRRKLFNTIPTCFSSFSCLLLSAMCNIFFVTRGQRDAICRFSTIFPSGSSSRASNCSSDWLVSELGAVLGSTPTLSFTFILSITDKNNQRVLYLACFSLFFISLCIQGLTKTQLLSHTMGDSVALQASKICHPSPPHSSFSQIM